MILSSDVRSDIFCNLTYRDCVLMHLINISARRENAVSLSDGNGSAAVYSPDDGLLHVLLKPGASDGFTSELLADTDLYLRSGILKGILANVRAANLLSVAFPSRLTTSRTLETFAFPSISSRIPSPGESQTIRTCGEVPSEILHSFILALTETDTVTVSVAEAGDILSTLIHDDDAFCLFADGHPVSMARISDRTGSTSRIGWVSTLPSYRGNGYASLLTGLLACRERKNGRTAVLLADLRNMPAMKCYTAAGFERLTHVRELTIVTSTAQ